VVGVRDYAGVPNQSDTMAASLRAAEVESTLLVVPGFGHGFIPATEAEQMLSFFGRHLK
jgi:dipeptidyl aminopeptidase/acylaminoacyl peptidase